MAHQAHRVSLYLWRIVTVSTIAEGMGMHDIEMLEMTPEFLEMLEGSRDPHSQAGLWLRGQSAYRTYLIHPLTFVP